MTTLIGLAFTHPSLAMLAIDRKKFRLHYHDQVSITDFRLFLDQKDNRTPVAIVNNVRDLNDLKSVSKDSLKTFVLFEDPETLEQIEGAILPDFRKDPLLGWCKNTITPDDFNKLLLIDSKDDFNIKQEAFRLDKKMSRPITFSELVKSIENAYTNLGLDSKQFVELACKYITKVISKRSWVGSARKPALEAGIPIKLLAELEANIETAKSSDELWRALYDHTINNVSETEILTKYLITKEDLDLIKKNVEVKSKNDFSMVPGEHKRKNKKNKV
jgi:hypothetical protein